jgi:hypothetical protein
MLTAVSRRPGRRQPTGKPPACVHYFEYAVSAIDLITRLWLFGTYSASPLPGRTFLAEGGMTRAEIERKPSDADLCMYD